MIRSAVTVSVVEEARGGPFVFWDGLENAFQAAAQLGFDAVEIFAPGPDFVSAEEILKLCQNYNLKVAAVGTGAGMVKHGLSLTDADDAKRKQAADFVKRMIQFGAQLSAPAIIGSMQGRWNAQVSRDQALDYLSAALCELGEVAEMNSVELFYEPLNRYETNLIKTMSEGCQFLQNLSRPNVKLLADLFHMNIEEASIEQALINAGTYVGHVHFVDSNRQAAGLGHINYPPIIQALKQINYQGYLSAEALPLPDSHTAATKTMEAIHRLVG
jgi:sugar phosphate isomerase/epimerase